MHTEAGGGCVERGGFVEMLVTWMTQGVKVTFRHAIIEKEQLVREGLHQQGNGLVTDCPWNFGEVACVTLGAVSWEESSANIGVGTIHKTRFTSLWHVES